MPMPAVSDRRAAMALAAIMTLFLAIAPCEGGQLPQYDDVVKRRVSSEAVLLDRHGDIIHEMRIDAHGRRLAWTRLDDVSPALIAAVLYSEDRHFHEHGGVDWKALAAAALQNLFSGRQRGASTITMQLAGMLEKDLTPPKGKRRSFEQKWNQVQAARKLEQTWTKSHILEAYLNLVSFRGELQGITSAARGIFGKEPSGLQDAESFILAALLRSPNTAPATAANRACTLAASMKSADACTDIQALAEQHLAGGYRIRQQTALAPHIAHQFLDRDHPRVRTTLDGPLQKFAVEMLSQQIRQLSPQNVNDGAVLVADNKTGAILAYVASAGSDASARHVDGILARRQAGSTLKPLLYALAIEHRLLTAASLLDDSPLNLPTETGLYVPRNYDNAFKGPVSARLSLASSLNIPAVQTLLLVGPEAFVARLKKLGFTDLNDADYYGYALALGTVDVSLHELTNAFRTLANQGVWSPLSVEDGKRSGNTRTVMSSDAAFIVSDILSDRSARSLTFGLENPLATRYWTAVKTGTSKDMR
ncbi:MAG TPA: penicillin-binding protein 1C, partial [Dissulfurispiraceae bacterium]|nr:penicillin-binding protein 1C [Dissulfurispiraceae bacterium]